MPKIFHGLPSYILNVQSLTEIFKGYISEITSTPENFGVHSLRSGGASAAANNGILDRLISKQGRWSSEKARKVILKTV